MVKQTVVVVVLLVLLAIALSVAIGLGLGLRRHAPRDDSDVLLPPSIRNQLEEKDKMEKKDSMTTTMDPMMVAEKEKEKEMEMEKKKENMSPHEKYRLTAVQTDASQCSKIGMDVIVGIEDAGAIDAAVAALFCIGVINIQSTGIGGGHFMTYFNAAEKKVHTRLSREVLPMNADKDFFRTHSSSQGGTSIGVPGEVKGLYTAWQLYGKAPWKRLVQPSIDLAENGFEIPGGLDDAIMRKAEDIMKDTNLRELFMSNGVLKRKGDILRRPKYAQTLRTIAENPESFYNGTLADDIVADVQDRGGIITKEDMMAYRTRNVTPIMGYLKNLNMTMYTPPPPSSGLIVQFIMRLLDGYNFTANDIKDQGSSVLTYHRLLEVWKYAYAQRSSLGDAAFYDVADVLKNLTDDTFVDATRAKINDKRTYEYDHYQPRFEIKPESGTVHLNVLAPDGSAVSMTSTINTYFGSLVLGTRTGIMFNNEMDDFSVPGQVNSWGFSPSPSNYAEPGKMPMSSMSPTIFLTNDDKVAFMGGAEGGSTIISATSFVAFHNLYLGLDLGAAMNHPRLHHQLLPAVFEYEEGWPTGVITGIISKGHEADGPQKSKSTVGAIRNRCATCQDMKCPADCIDAVSDKRKGGGEPAGY